MPGPIGKRDAERRRRNKPETPTIKVDLGETLSAEIEIPAPDEDWHPIANNWYMSLTKSGQAIFYEPSDWQTAYVLAETLSRELNPQEVQVGDREVLDPDRPYDEKGAANKIGKDIVFELKYKTMSAATLNALIKGMTNLMVTEGDRRRLKIELDRQKLREAAGATGGNVIPIVAERDARFRDAR